MRIMLKTAFLHEEKFMQYCELSLVTFDRQEEQKNSMS